MPGKRPKKSKKNKRYTLLLIVCILVFLTGFGILMYPTFSDAWNRYRNSQLITDYQQSVQDLSADDYSEVLAKAQEYNGQHTVNTIEDAFDDEGNYEVTHPYDEILNPNGDGIMGSIEIPKIGVDLAIYHGTGAEALEKGAGHLKGTSLPIGGKNTHAVISGHRGLPSAKLFTDLDQLGIGDVFYIHVLNETLAYEVDQIKTVLPTETEDLAIIPGGDYVTLVTCTPYGVNTHRLLVRGTRIPDTGETETVSSMTEETTGVQETSQNRVRILICGVITFAVIMLVLVMVMKRRRNTHRKDGR